VRLLIFPVASTGYLVWVTIQDSEGTFVHNPRSGRVGRGIALEDGPEPKDNLNLMCGLFVEPVG
jgi:hypothetical protein